MPHEMEFRADSTLIYGATLPLTNLNPNVNDWNEASSLIVSRLFNIDLYGRVEGDLVESFGVSDDFKTYVLRLRTGVLWHDGMPFTSEDVLFTVRGILDPSEAVGTHFNLGGVRSLEAPDSHSVVIELDEPNPTLTTPLTAMGMLPRHIFADSKKDMNDTFNDNPIGTGPYKLVKRTESKLIFEANRDYFKGSPNIAHLILHHIPNDIARGEAIINGEVEIAQVKPISLPRLSQAAGISLYRFRTGVWRAIKFNLNKPALKDRRVRLAISTALDREAMVEKGLGGMGQVASSPIPPTNWAYPENLEPPKRDIDRARRLLDEAGWKLGVSGVREKDGIPLELTIIALKEEVFRSTAAQIAKENLAEIGINVFIKPVGFDEYSSSAEAMGVNDAIIVGWSGLLDPFDNLAKKYKTGGSQNTFNHSNPILDNLLDRAHQETDPQKARQMYLKAVEVIAEDSIMPPLVNPDYVFAAQQNVTGLGDYVLDNFYEFTRFAHLLGKDADRN